MFVFAGPTIDTSETFSKKRPRSASDSVQPAMIHTDGYVWKTAIAQVTPGGEPQSYIVDISPLPDISEHFSQDFSAASARNGDDDQWKCSVTSISPSRDDRGKLQYSEQVYRLPIRDWFKKVIQIGSFEGKNIDAFTASPPCQ